MEPEAPRIDLAPLLAAAADFASYPGMQNDAAAKEFLDRFPIPVLFGVLQNGADVPCSEDTVASCLDRLFKTKYGASHLLQYIPFVRAGLQANSENIRCLSCKAVSDLLEYAEDNEAAVQIIDENHIYPLLIKCLSDGNKQTAAASMNAVKNIACSPTGINIIFPSSSEASMQLKSVALNCSSLLVTSLYSTSFPVTTCLLRLLTELICNFSVEPILRSSAIMVGRRLVTSSDAYTDIHVAGIKICLLAVYGRLEELKSQNTDEIASALEALRQLGTYRQGATLLLTSSPVIARHVVDSAFNGHGRDEQLAALHALGSICGVDRLVESMLLNNSAEESLRRLIYETAANSSKLTPSGLLVKVLQQGPEIRLAAYSLISVLVARSWCLAEVCSRQEMITMVTDPNAETTKINMEARHDCCRAIKKALSDSNMLNDASVGGVVEKLQDAVNRGPYLAKRRIEAQPIVMTAERF